MAYNQQLVSRIGECVGHLAEVKLLKMFGGVCYTYNGHMAWGVKDNRLIVRVGADNYEQVLKLKNVLPFDATGRPMKSFVYVVEEGFKNDKALQKWVNRGMEFVSTLPPKN